MSWKTSWNIGGNLVKGMIPSNSEFSRPSPAFKKRWKNSAIWSGKSWKFISQNLSKKKQRRLAQPATGEEERRAARHIQQADYSRARELLPEDVLADIAAMRGQSLVYNKPSKPVVPAEEDAVVAEAVAGVHTGAEL